MLINVAPPKPTRLLTEMERKALLMHDLSPGTPVSLDSQKVPMYENGNRAPDYEQDDLYNIHWDMLNEDILLSLEKESLFPEFYDPPRLELDLDTNWIEAPLASPEELSVASGLFGLSRDSSYKTKCVSSTSVRLETIHQSPDMKVKIDTPSKGSLDDVVDDKDGAGISEATVSEAVDQVEDLSAGSVLTGIDNPIGSSSAALSEEHKQSSDPTQSDLHDIIEDLGIPSHHLSPEIQSPSFNNTDNSATECDNHNSYNRHSPVESSQFQHLNPNDQYSQAGLGYTPELLGIRRPSPKRHLSPNVPSPNNKRLHYSQSESYIGTLSDKYSMKRSREQGDIAHLQDTARVYEANSSKSQEKLLKPRESEPLFEESKLPVVHSAILEASSHLEDEENTLIEAGDSEIDDSYLEINADMNKESEQYTYQPHSQILTEHGKLVKSDELPAVEIDETLVMSADSLLVDGKDFESCLTTSRLSVSEYSGSEKRSSSSSGQLTSGHSISDHSEEYASMMESDV